MRAAGTAKAERGPGFWDWECGARVAAKGRRNLIMLSINICKHMQSINASDIP